MISKDCAFILRHLLGLLYCIVVPVIYMHFFNVALKIVVVGLVLLTPDRLLVAFRGY